MNRLPFYGYSVFFLPLLLVFSAVIKASDFPVIVVTPGRVETAIDQSPVPVLIISRQQIENNNSQDVADIIQHYAGLEVARNGGYGKVTSLFVRGTESNHTVVLVDGVKINPATIGSAAIQNISPAIIDHIEIIKGPRSSVYGSEAIGGVVNIITRRDLQGSQGKITLGLGDNHTRKAAVDLLYGNENLSTGLIMESFSTDGFPVTDQSSEDHGYDNETLNAFVNYRLDAHSLNFRHWQSSGNVEYYSFGELNQNFNNSASSLQWDYDLNDTLKTALRVSQVEDKIQQEVANYLAQFDKSITIRDELDLKLEYRINIISTLSAGILTTREEVDALSYGTRIDEKTDIDEWYALFQGSRGKHDYSMSLRSTDHPSFGQQNTWNMDYQYHFHPAARLYTGIGTAFRAPDSTDRFGYGGNPDLNPETARNFELGLIVDLNHSSQFKLSAFRTTIDDLIVLTGNWPDYSLQNVDEAEITGIELSLTQQLDAWHYQFNAVLQNPVNKTLDEPLSRRAQSTVNLTVGYSRPQWQISSNISVVSARDDSSFNDIILPQYELVDLSMSYQLSKKLKLSTKVDNLFNENYQTAAGFNSKSRTLMMELSYQFIE